MTHVGAFARGFRFRVGVFELYVIVLFKTRHSCKRRIRMKKSINVSSYIETVG